MKEFEFIKLPVDFRQDIFDMFKDIEAVENGFTNPAKNLVGLDYQNWLKSQEDHSFGLNLPIGYVPCTIYVLFCDKIPVGFGRLRHETNDELETVKGVGNFGYGICKTHRGKGYGTVLFSYLIKECKKLGFKQLKFFPYKENKATLRVMEKFGGKVIGTFNEQKYIVEMKI